MVLAFRKRHRGGATTPSMLTVNPPKRTILTGRSASLTHACSPLSATPATWDAQGMRATESHDTVLDGAGRKSSIALVAGTLAHHP